LLKGDDQEKEGGKRVNIRQRKDPKIEKILEFSPSGMNGKLENMQERK